MTLGGMHSASHRSPTHIGWWHPETAIPPRQPLPGMSFGGNRNRIRPQHESSNPWSRLQIRHGTDDSVQLDARQWSNAAETSAPRLERGGPTSQGITEVSVILDSRSQRIFRGSIGWVVVVSPKDERSCGDGPTKQARG